MKKGILLVSTLLIMSLTGCEGKVDQVLYDDVKADYENLLSDYQKLNSNYKELQNDYDALKKEYDDYKAEEKAKQEELIGDITSQDKSEYESSTITYDDLARKPQDYEMQKVKFEGKVVQLMENEGEDYVSIRFAVNDDYDKIIYCEFDRNIVGQRVLEGDWLNIYGVSGGLMSYQSTLGGTITIPAVLVNIIEFQD